MLIFLIYRYVTNYKGGMIVMLKKSYQQLVLVELGLILNWIQVTLDKGV